MVSDSSGQTPKPAQSPKQAQSPQQAGTPKPADADSDLVFRNLLQRGRAGDKTCLGQLLQMYANYLAIFATSNLDRRLRRRVSPSDVVQDAMLAANRDFDAFRGSTQQELLAWLRQILINTLHRSHATHCKAKKRDVRREVSFEAVSKNLDQSATRLQTLLCSDVESPSGSMRARESAVELANELAKLAPPYRDVIVYRILQGLSFTEIAERMGRSSGAVRMLWLRALAAFKATRESNEEQDL